MLSAQFGKLDDLGILHRFTTANFWRDSKQDGEALFWHLVDVKLFDSLEFSKHDGESLSVRNVVALMFSSAGHA